MVDIVSSTVAVGKRKMKEKKEMAEKSNTSPCHMRFLMYMHGTSSKSSILYR